MLYLTPLRALLNNLAPRVSAYAGWLGRRVDLWHGDVGPSARRSMLTDPPDLLLSNYLHAEVGCHQDLVPLCPDVGANAGIALARRWRAILASPVREGWRCDVV